MELNKLLSKDLSELTFSVVDTETTGMYASTNRVMDIGIVQIKNGQIVKEWEELIDPKQEIPYWITNFTNLRQRDVEGKPTFENFIGPLQQILSDTIFVAHNVGFDYNFIYHEFKRAKQRFKLPRLCTVQLSRKLLPELGRYNLDVLSNHYNIEIENRHRALPDAKATAIILIDLIQQAKKQYGAKTFFDLEKIQRIKIEPQQKIQSINKNQTTLL